MKVFMAIAACTASVEAKQCLSFAGQYIRTPHDDGQGLYTSSICQEGWTYSGQTLWNDLDGQEHVLDAMTQGASPYTAQMRLKTSTGGAGIYWKFDGGYLKLYYSDGKTLAKEDGYEICLTVEGGLVHAVHCTPGKDDKWNLHLSSSAEAGNDLKWNGKCVRTPNDDGLPLQVGACGGAATTWHWGSSTNTLYNDKDGSLHVLDAMTQGASSVKAQMRPESSTGGAGIFWFYESGALKLLYSDKKTRAKEDGHEVCLTVSGSTLHTEHCAGPYKWTVPSGTPPLPPLLADSSQPTMV